MRLVTASTGKQAVKISKSEWLSIGQRAGWISSHLEKTAYHKVDPNGIPEFSRKIIEALSGKLEISFGNMRRFISGNKDLSDIYKFWSAAPEIKRQKYIEQAAQLVVEIKSSDMVVKNEKSISMFANELFSICKRYNLMVTVSGLKTRFLKDYKLKEFYQQWQGIQGEEAQNFLKNVVFQYIKEQSSKPSKSYLSKVLHNMPNGAIYSEAFINRYLYSDPVLLSLYEKWAKAQSSIKVGLVSKMLERLEEISKTKSSRPKLTDGTGVQDQSGSYTFQAGSGKKPSSTTV
jgi:hypothetical protein